MPKQPAGGSPAHASNLALTSTAAVILPPFCGIRCWFCRLAALSRFYACCEAAATFRLRHQALILQRRFNEQPTLNHTDRWGRSSDARTNESEYKSPDTKSLRPVEDFERALLGQERRALGKAAERQLNTVERGQAHRARLQPLHGIAGGLDGVAFVSV